MWSSHELNARRVDLFEAAGARLAVLCLPDLDGLSLRELDNGTEFLRRHRLAAICPHSEKCWWSDHICADFDPKQSAERWVTDTALPHFKDRFDQIAVAGVGMGGQGALRLAFKHPDRFRIVAALDAAIDHHELYGEGTPLDEMYPSREHCRQDTATLHVHPARQPAHIWFACDPASRWFRGNDRLHEKLSALGVPHTFAERSSEFTEMFGFVAEALGKEQRSLV